MRDVKIKKIIENVFITFLVDFLIYLGTSNNILNKLQDKGILGNSVDINSLKDGILLIGIVLSTLLLSINLCIKDIREINFRNQLSSLLKYNKKIFMETLANQLELENLDLDMRIFIPKSNLLDTILNKVARMFHIKRKKVFRIINIEGLSDPGITNNLGFEVFPNIQGLVGQCYNKKDIVYDENLAETNNVNYNLNKYQIDKTMDLKFSLCAPICNEKDEVIAIVAFDSKRDVKISTKWDKAIWKETFIGYCQYLYQYIPDLFKKRW